MAEVKAAPLAFQQDLVAALPRLRVHALALTRNRAGADDLVHDAVCNALRAHASFAPGSNFQAWTHRILRNRFISNLREARDAASIEDVPAELFRAEPSHEHRLALRELAEALKQLPDEQREALTRVVFQGLSYDELAEVAGCAVGTAKSRVFRARCQLAATLDGTDRRSVAAAQRRRRLAFQPAVPEPVALHRLRSHPRPGAAATTGPPRGLLKAK